MTSRQVAIVLEMALQLIASLALLAVPYIAHTDLLFGVPVGRGFRSTQPGRRSLRSYGLWVAFPLAASLLGIILFPNPIVSASALLSTVVLGVTGFVMQNRKLKPFALQLARVPQAELGTPEGLPWFGWLGILPLAFLAGAAAYLYTHWDRIPLQYPVHFDLTGAPDRWADRSARGVFGPLIIGGGLAVWMFAAALAGWYGSRRSDSMRKPMLAVILASQAIVAFLFGQVSLQPALGFPIPIFWIVVGPLIFLIPAIAYAVRESKKARDPVDPTPNECWKGGMIYYNPHDAALLVQRRDSIGFTLNLANRWSWVLLGALALILASAVFMLP